jgi:ABC-2 type transport system permease protein
MMGTLELSLAAPTRLFTVLLGRSLGNGITGLAGGLITAACVMWATGASISFDQPIALCVSMGLSLLCLCAFGVFFSPIYLVSRRPAGMLFVLSLAMVMFSGTLYPKDALPAWLQAVSVLVPPHWAAEALRFSLDGSSGLEDLIEPWVALIGLTIGYLAAAYGLLALIERRQRQTGQLQFF